MRGIRRESLCVIGGWAKSCSWIGWPHSLPLFLGSYRGGVFILVRELLFIGKLGKELLMVRSTFIFHASSESVMYFRRQVVYASPRLSVTNSSALPRALSSVRLGTIALCARTVGQLSAIFFSPCFTIEWYTLFFKCLLLSGIKSVSLKQHLRSREVGVRCADSACGLFSSFALERRLKEANGGPWAGNGRWQV